jgi:hypothetical protein
MCTGVITTDTPIGFRRSIDEPIIFKILIDELAHVRPNPLFW